jgi:hypothetical protein
MVTFLPSSFLGGAAFAATAQMPTGHKRSALAGTIHRPGRGPGDHNASACRAVEKPRAGKVKNTAFPTGLCR